MRKNLSYSTPLLVAAAAIAFAPIAAVPAIAFAPIAAADVCDKGPAGNPMLCALQNSPRNTECFILNPSAGWIRYDENGGVQECTDAEIDAQLNR